MLKFILNDELIETDVAEGTTLLDFVRYNQNLKATKIGCREGDCGACTLLFGELKNDKLVYKSVTSCITPVINAAGKHVVSLEGLNMDELTEVQKSMMNNSASQCGFCTPGFVVSLTGYCLSRNAVSEENSIDAIDGNICRCTGYKSIERAANDLNKKLTDKDCSDPVKWAVNNGFVPGYFGDIENRLRKIEVPESSGRQVVGGGTDLYVQRHDFMEEQNELSSFSAGRNRSHISIEDGYCRISASCVAGDLMESDEMNSLFPDLKRYLKLVSSTPVRNIGTIAGNFVNASPIGDLTVFFLALDASLILTGKSGETRNVALRSFYKGYKLIDKREDEVVSVIVFPVPSKGMKFNFEKVSKRQYLDIASVNTACSVSTDESGNISQIVISAGGVGPTPRVLENLSSSLTGKKLNIGTVTNSLAEIDKDISPISDVRGTAAYKKLLLSQLIKAHFIELFPHLIKEEELI